MPSSETTDPLDTPLPCDIVLGSCTFRQGVSLRTFVEAARRWRATISEIELVRQQRDAIRDKYEALLLQLGATDA